MPPYVARNNMNKITKIIHFFISAYCITGVFTRTSTISPTNLTLIENLVLTHKPVITEKPLLVLVLMVKNEAHHNDNEAPAIIRTLQPFVGAGLKYIVLFDTGSTDGTQEIVKNFFTQHNLIHSHVVEEPFINFAASRNRALEVTQQLFPDATFMLMPDAEWYITNAKTLIDFCDIYKNHHDNSYFISIKSSTQAFVTPRLIRCGKNVHFIGVVHETLSNDTFITVPDDCYFEWLPTHAGNQKSVQRFVRDCNLLLAEHLKYPHDPRTIFYLAQTYDLLGDFENAYLYYQKRSQIPGPNEDQFVTLLRLGAVAEQLENPHNINKVTPLAVQHYLEAFNTRPHRAEPFIRIANYYLRKNMMHLAFLYAKRACDIPYPKNDLLFVEKYMYDFTRYDIVGIAAWYIGEYEAGEWAVKQAMKTNPNAPHLHFNLKLYNDRKAASTQLIKQQTKQNIEKYAATHSHIPHAYDFLSRLQLST